MRPERSWARPEGDEMEFIYKSGQGKRVTWTHSNGNPPETDKQGGERNGHGPRTHETDTPTGNVCTNIIIQQESRAHTRKPMFTP